MTEPACPFSVKAIADYTARNETEVCLVGQQIYTVEATDGKGVWWQTTISGKAGWFPANYVTVVESAPPPPPVQQTPEPTTPEPVAQQPVETSTSQSTTPTEKKKKTNGERSGSSRKNGEKKTGRKKRDDGRSSKKKKQKEKKEKKEQVPQPSKAPQVEDDQTSAYLLIQVVEAKEMRTVGGDSDKCNPGIVIYRRTVFEPNGRGDFIFKSDVQKKTNAPNWNERFQINVEDSETEIIMVKFGSGGKKSGMKGKNFMGQIDFTLRSAVRDFDRPNYQFKWYPIMHEGEKMGEAKVFIEFVDTRAVGKPKDFQQVSHIGWSADGGFDINNIPQEWKKIFKAVGIRKKDLESNPELAGDILNIMNQATEEADGATINESTAVSQPASVTPVSNAPTPPPAPVINTNAPPPPPPPPGVNIAAPPAPSGGGLLGELSTASLSATPQTGTTLSPQASLLDQIRKGKTLNAVDTSNTPPPPPAGGSSLADTLRMAMFNHRGAIEGDDDDESSGDDWSSSE